MTALELYNATLIELNKLNTPTFTVEQFNYFVNKAIQAFTDRRYNFYAMNQQLTDDLRVLLSTYTVPSDDLSGTGLTVKSFIKEKTIGHTKHLVIGVVTEEKLLLILRAGDQIFLEGDTRLRLVTKTEPATNSIWFTPAIRVMDIGEEEGANEDTDPFMTSTLKVEIGAKIFKSNHIFNPSSTLSDNRILSYDLTKSDYYHMLSVRTYWEGTRQTESGDPCTEASAIRKMYPAKRLTYDMLANIENNAYLRPMYRQPYYLLQDNLLNKGTDPRDPQVITNYQNSPRIEIHMGKKVLGIDLISVEVDYLKLPEVVVLTEEEAYVNTEDISQVLEWPDYLNSELISNLVSYFIENEMNPRGQSFPQLQQDTPQVPLEMGGQ